MSNNLPQIQQKLRLYYGHWYEELPEQEMVAQYLTGKETVLEIGGNIGRNSLVIASILDDSRRLVTFESDVGIAEQLRHNRDQNHLHFHIEPCALSLRPLIQRDWVTKILDSQFEQSSGYRPINTITWRHVLEKYPHLTFDTIVLDCEGAFYQILKDMPYILDTIQLIIMENDYTELHEKKYVDDILRSKQFHRINVRSGGWGPCFSCFYEVWERAPSPPKTLG